MKKIIALALALVMAMSVFVGCAESSSPQKEEPTVVTTPVASTEPVETTETVEVTEANESKPTQEIINGWVKQELKEADSGWIDTGLHGIDVSVGAYMRGYPEICLDNESITNISMYEKDDMLVITYTEYGYEWELHAARASEFINISGIDEKDFDFVIENTRDNNVHAKFVRTKKGEHINLYYAELTGNVYSHYCKDDPQYTTVISGWDENKPFFPDGFWVSPGSGLFYPNVTPVISEMKVYFGEDEVKTYPYRTGTTFGDWAVSELNTDGWHMNQSGWVMSPDGKWSTLGCEPIIGSVHPVQKTYGYNNVQYDENILYCFNSNTRLYVAGIQVVSTSFPEDNPDWRRISRVANHLGTNDDIKFIFDVYYEELIPDMKVYFAPHSDSTTELPENTTEYSVYKETVTREFVLNEPVDVIAAVMNYKPAEDPNFVANSMDMFITYQREVIYKIALPRFE